MMRPEQDMSLVHESQSFTRTGTVPSKIPLTVSATIKESGASKVLNFSLQEENGAALGSMQTRLRTVTAAEMVRFKGSAFPDHMDKGDVIWLWSDPFSKSTVQAYLTLACDPNPIHRSDEQAKLAGLPGAVVPGMLFAGVAEFMLARALPGGAVKSMKMRFMAPVLIGEALQYGVLPRKTGNDGRPKTVRIFVVRSDKMIAAIADLDL
ncbi:MaoC family dehydratase [Shimia gijangensis]|nr:MaoC family dehydratase [Shimia gijangensis]